MPIGLNYLLNSYIYIHNSCVCLVSQSVLQLWVISGHEFTITEVLKL